MARINTGFISGLASFIAAFLLAISAASVAQAAGEMPLEIKKGGLLLGFSFKDDSGATYQFMAKDRLTVLHFWATWCVPCLAELPQIDAVAAKYQAYPFRVYAISLDGKGGKAAKFLADHGIKNLQPYLDDNALGDKSLRLKGLPTTIFIDETGNEIARGEGALNWQSKEVADFIETHLK